VIDERLAAVTVSVVPAEMVPDAALMFVVPTVRLWARPVASTVATDGLDEDQVTDEVISSMEPSEKAPVTVTCWLRPFAILGAAGASAMDTSIAGETVNVAVPETPRKVAMMVEDPTVTALDCPAPLTVATAVVEDDQVAAEVKS
jgi:hypothetical protein